MPEPSTADAEWVNCTDAPPTAPSDLMTTGDVVREYPWTNRMRLAEIMDSGHLPFYRFGGEGSRRYVSRADWNTYVAAHRQEPTP